jgi:hypothetical protein
MWNFCVPFNAFPTFNCTFWQLPNNALNSHRFGLPLNFHRFKYNSFKYNSMQSDYHLNQSYLLFLFFSVPENFNSVLGSYSWRWRFLRSYLCPNNETWDRPWYRCSQKACEMNRQQRELQSSFLKDFWLEMMLGLLLWSASRHLILALIILRVWFRSTQYYYVIRWKRQNHHRCRHQTPKMRASQLLTKIDDICGLCLQ